MFVLGHPLQRGLQNVSGPAANSIQVPAALFTASLMSHKY